MKLIDYPLYHKPTEIKAVLTGVAGQEGNDGPEYDLMVEAADYIRNLEELQKHLICKLQDIDPQFVKIMEKNFWNLLA